MSKTREGVVEEKFLTKGRENSMILTYEKKKENFNDIR